MKTAFAYARVSSKEQEEKNNSIPEQFNRIEKFANENSIKITKRFCDSDSAFHDENRENFEQMIQLALKEKPTYILLDDSSRFARTRQVAIGTKALLRSHGINILYASEPNVDINSPSGFWIECLQETKNEATSREISFHTKKGMTGNLRQRDIETGWCYKNGGKPPYGYKRVVLDKGINQKGKPIFKTIWQLDDVTYPIVRKIIVDLYTNKQMSYQSIRDYLNLNNIKNPNGNIWSTSTISSMLTPDRLEEYAGIAIWNKSNKTVKGVKYNPKDEWVICENAHPAIITKEELQNALMRKQKTANNHSAPKTTSTYLLSGYNIENNFLFTCSECYGHVIGFSSGKKHIKKYTCANNNHKGSCCCKNNWKIDKDWIEDKVLNIIEENYICDKNIDKNVDLIYSQLSNLSSQFETKIDNIKKQINKIDSQMQNLLDSIKNGLDSEIAIQEINNLKKEREEKEKNIEDIKNAMTSTPSFTKCEIKSYFLNIQKVFYVADPTEKRELLKTFIYNISLNYSEHQIEISLFNQWFASLEQVAGIEPA